MQIIKRKKMVATYIGQTISDNMEGGVVKHDFPYELIVSINDDGGISVKRFNYSICKLFLFRTYPGPVSFRDDWFFRSVLIEKLKSPSIGFNVLPEFDRRFYKLRKTEADMKRLRKINRK